MTLEASSNFHYPLERGLRIVKPYIPDGADDLMSDLEVLEKSLPSSIICVACDQSLLLREVNITWPVRDVARGSVEGFYMGPTLGYQCDPCERIYLERNMFNPMIRCVEGGIKELSDVYKQPDGLEIIRPDNIIPFDTP